MKTYSTFSLLLLVFILACSPKNKKGMDNIISEFEQLQQDFETDSDWPQIDSEELNAQKERMEEFRNALKELDSDDLTMEDRINKDMLELILTDEIEGIKFGTHEFALNAEGGFLTGIVFGIRGMTIQNEEDEKRYLKKLQALPAYLESRMNHLSNGMESGVVSPKLITRICLEMVEEVANSKAEDTFFAQPAKGTNIEEEVNRIINDEILPSYNKLASFLNGKYLPNAPEAIGVRSITGGEAFYEHRVRYFATDEITPQEVFDIGMAEVKRIRKEMEAIIKDLEFDGDFEAFQEFLRTSPQFYAKSPQEILNKAAWITKQMEGELPKYFGKLPRVPLTVKPVPAAIAPNYTSGRYSPGSKERKKAGEYWVNTTKLDSRPLYALPALTLHEGVPGHHTQIMLAAELDMPDFRRSTYLSAFGEGWALYCEYLGKEAGMYTTPYEDYGRLVYEMWRACRLVVDPGMHYLGWSRDAAFEFMKENTALSILEIDNEINRYIGWPGQAISYKLGELKIKELRTYAESELGEAFDLSAFHDQVLSNCSVPLNTLEKIIKDWVIEEKAS